jgi:hypothetical protein
MTHPVVKDVEMKDGLLPEAVAGAQESPQMALPLAAEGVQRLVWQSRFGDMLIEVRDGVAFVNGQRVERFEAEAAAGRSGGA